MRSTLPPATLHRYVSLVIDRFTAQGLDTDGNGSAMMYKNGKAARKTTTAGVNVDEVLPASDKKYFIHTVKPGDWLSKIAIANNCTVEEIIALNGIKNKDLIVTGQQIKVPQK